MEVRQPKLYARFIQSILALEEGEIPPEPLAFFDEDKKLNAARFLFVITDPFHIDLNSKKNLTALYTRIENLVVSDAEQYAQWLRHSQSLHEIIDKQTVSLNVDVSQNDELSVVDYCRAQNMRLTFHDQDDLYHRLLNLMDIMSEFMPERLLVLCNIKDFLTAEELRELYKYANYVKIMLFHIEKALAPDLSENEIRWVIDEDYDDYIVRGRTV